MQFVKGVKLMILFGTCIGVLSYIVSANGADDLFVSSTWSTAVAFIPQALQWPAVIEKLGRKLPTLAMDENRVNPACLVALYPPGSIHNTTREHLPWPPEKRSRIMYEAAKAYNQEVWIGTKHREYLKVREQQGDIEVMSTLSVLSCERSSNSVNMYATIESLKSRGSWLRAEDIPCGTVRMPSWLFTKKPLDAEQRRIRQGVMGLKKDTTGSRAGVEFSSLWYSPFTSSKELSNARGWIGESNPMLKTSEGAVNVDYEHKTLLDRQDSVVVDAGINQIGFHWEKPDRAVDFFRNMEIEACLDDHGTEACKEQSMFRGNFMNYPISYVPWLDRWTFSPSDWKNSCAMQEDQNTSSNCSQPESEVWKFPQLEIRELIDGAQKAEPVVPTGSYDVFLDECPSSLVLSPGNVSNLRLNREDRFRDQHYRGLIDNSQSIHLHVERRISKDGIQRSPISTLFLALMTGIEGLLVSASWEITLTASKLIVSFFSTKDVKWKMKYAKMLSQIASGVFAVLATLPVAFLLRDELKKTRDVRVDGDIVIELPWQSSIEGDELFVNVFVVAVEVRDVSSRWKECTIILIAIALVGLLIVAKRIKNLKKSQGRFFEAISLLGAVEP